MKKIVIYPGRFQPMLSHHAEVYRQLQAQFPDADVYIGTSDKIDPPKSPFSFVEKQQIAKAHGIDPSKVLQAKSPYHKDSYPFDQDNSVIIFAVGEKDLDRFPFSSIDPSTGLDMTKRGEPKPRYYQKIDTMADQVLPMSERGYITLAPTIRTGNVVASASDFRQSLIDSPDEDSAKQLYTQQFGEYDEKTFNLIYNKIVGNKMNEQLNTLRQLAGLPLMESAPVQMKQNFGMSEAERVLAEVGRIIMDMAIAERDDGLSSALSRLGGQMTDGEITDQSDLINAIKAGGEHAKDLSDATKQAFAKFSAGETADVQGDEVEPDMDDEDDQYESVDLSEFYDDEDGEEEHGSEPCPSCGNMSYTDGTCSDRTCDSHGQSVSEEAEGSDILVQIEDLADNYGLYGDCDMDAVNAGAEEVAACYSTQDGGEGPHMDDFYVGVQQLLADHGLGESVEENIQQTAANGLDAALAELRKLSGM